MFHILLSCDSQGSMECIYVCMYVTEKEVWPRNAGVDPRDLCETKRYWKRLSSFLSFGIIPPMLHIHLSAAVIRRTSVSSLKSSNKAIAFPQIRRIAKQV